MPRLLLALLVVLLAPAATSAQRVPPTSKPAPPVLVVILHSYDSSVDWSHDITEGVFEGLREAGMPVDLREEFLDARRDVRPAYLQHVREALREKYSRMPPAIVVTADDAALEFLLDAPELFTGRPIVFGGVENAALVARAPRDRVTGVMEEFRVGTIVDLMASLRPVRRVFVVTAATNGGTALRAKFADLRRPGVEIVQVSGAELTLPQVLTRLRTETRADDLVVAMPVTRDVRGDPYEVHDTVQAITEASQAPVVGIAFSDLGQGVVATTASTGGTHGRWIAHKVLQVWKGTATAAIPIETDPETRLAFDAPQLARWGIAERALPAGTDLRNAQPSFLRTYRRVIWAAVAFLVLQSMVIGGLIIAVRQRRRAERGLEQQARALSAANRELADVNHSLLREQQVRQQTEEHLRHSQKMEAVGRLAGGIAHDFNNLLTVIIGYCALLIEDAGDHSPHGEALAQIRRASEQAATLTQNLLAFSRKQVLTAVIVDVSAAIAGLAPMVRRFCGERVDLGLDLDTHTGFVELGEGQLEQVLVNLVINARDAMPDGGRLRVSARAATLTAASLPSPDLTPGPFVVIAVSDTGHGMDDETRARIFEPFFTTKEMGRGTGLGLATVYGIVAQHRGAVTVDSEPGKGATFTVWLPRTDRRPASRVADGATVVPPAGQTVLLVEDEAALRTLVAQVLKQAGFHVLDAADGEEALALASRHPGRIDLLLSDVVMPGPDGFEIARQLRAARPGLAVSFMSGYAEHGEDAVAPDPDWVALLLRKPFMPGDLLAHVRRALDGRRTTASAGGA